MLGTESKQVKMYDDLLERIVPKDHPYRKISNLIDFEALVEPLKDLYSSKGKHAIPLTIGFKCLLIQFYEDLSDRQLEKFLSDSNSAKWFCGYGLEDTTPGHTYFCKLRKRIGPQKLSKLFNKVTEGIKKAGFATGTFVFVDASSMLAKVDQWKARDKAIQDKKNKERDDNDNPKMNNKNVK